MLIESVNVDFYSSRILYLPSVDYCSAPDLLEIKLFSLFIPPFHSCNIIFLQINVI